MKTIHGQYKKLPIYWKKRYLAEGGVETDNFEGCVHLQWEDGSSSFFKYAFLVHEKSRKEICVFSEHCGYYVFSTIGLDYWYNLKFGE